MGKISLRPQSKKRRSNSIQSENDQQEDIPVNVKQESELYENSVSEPRQNQSAGCSVLTPSTSTSLSLNTSALDGSYIFSPAFCHNNVEQITINSSFVNITPASRERNPDPQAQVGLSDVDASTTTILRTPKKSKKSRRSRRSAARRSLILPCAIVGEITGALVTSEYHCSECRYKIPSWKPPRFRVRCPGCKTSWRCDKVRCTCKAKITLEQPSGQMQRVTLEDSLLHSIVRFKQQGYCKTENIETKVLKVGRVRLEYNDGAVTSVTKILSGSMSLRDMPDDFSRDSD